MRMPDLKVRPTVNAGRAFRLRVKLRRTIVALAKVVRPGITYHTPHVLADR